MSNENHAANPAPAGLVALAMACFTFYALLSGKVDHTAIAALGCWLLGGFVVQIVVAVMELKHGNSTGGNVFLFFSAFFMFTAGFEMLVKFFAASKGLQIDARIDGWAWLPLAIALTCWTPAYFKSSLTMLVVVIVLDPALYLLAFMDMGILAKTWAPLTGLLILIGGIFGLYTATAMILNTAYNKQILPTGGPLIKG